MHRLVFTNSDAVQPIRSDYNVGLELGESPRFPVGPRFPHPWRVDAGIIRCQYVIPLRNVDDGVLFAVSGTDWITAIGDGNPGWVIPSGSRQELSVHIEHDGIDVTFVDHYGRSAAIRDLPHTRGVIAAGRGQELPFRAERHG